MSVSTRTGSGPGLAGRPGDRQACAKLNDRAIDKRRARLDPSRDRFRAIHGERALSSERTWRMGIFEEFRHHPFDETTVPGHELPGACSSAPRSRRDQDQQVRQISPGCSLRILKWLRAAATFRALRAQAPGQHRARNFFARLRPGSSQKNHARQASERFAAADPLGAPGQDARSSVYMVMVAILHHQSPNVDAGHGEPRFDTQAMQWHLDDLSALVTSVRSRRAHHRTGCMASPTASSRSHPTSN